MADRVDVIALRPLILGGRAYQPGDHVAMVEARVRQYELIARRTGHAIVSRATADGARAPIEAETPSAPPPPTPEPVAPTREATVVHGEPRRRTYRNRQIQSED